MTDVNIEVLKLQQEATLKREELQAEVKKVVYGTFLVGVAVALFPVISGWIEHRYNLRIEETRQVNQLALQENQLKLDLQKLVQEVDAAKTKASFETEQSDRAFFESIADETRSANLSDRITIAEFFTYLATTEEERVQWGLFRDRLQKLQTEFNQNRPELMRVIADPGSTESQVQEAIAQLRQIDERESGVASAKPLRWQQLVPLSDLDLSLGKGQSLANDEFLRGLFGEPISVPSVECQAPDNADFSRLIETANVGPFNVSLIHPATRSLQEIFGRVKIENPELYEQIGGLGGLCVRLVRGSTSAMSNHSWGTAVDLSIGGQIDRYGDDQAMLGLAELSRYFKEAGWIWGAAFPNEDSMHFEVSREKLQEWSDSGVFSLSAAAD